MRNLKSLVIGLMSLVSVGVSGQNLFVQDTSKQKTGIPYLDAINYGNKKVYTEKDSLGRAVLEIDWYNGLREEIKKEYKGKGDTLLSNVDVIYNNSNNIRKSLNERKYIFTKDTIFIESTEIKFDEKENIKTKIQRNIKNYPKRFVEVITLKDLDGDGKFEKGMKTVTIYNKEQEKKTKIYMLDKDGSFKYHSGN